MSTTTISVRGEAHDERMPDRAVVRLAVRSEGRHWLQVHGQMTASLRDLRDAMTELTMQHRLVVPESSIGHMRQQTWTDKDVKFFSEEALASLVFTDFELMNTWISQVVSDTVHVKCLNWSLSSPVQDAVRRSLGNAAVRDARARAEVFATAAGLHIVGIQALADPGMLGDDADESPTNNPLIRATLLSGAPASSTADDGYDLTPQLVESTAQVEARFLAE
ncbi:MAG: SIMPL domain-containing protein [Propionibacteriaceae bacterium]|nr:SIMPL domain-containing protein [Propionibacteriaceae bacterium]